MKILVVDDDPFIREVVGEFLEPLNAAVTLCRNADEALEALRKGRYDLLITDIVMPGKTGIELIEQVKREKIKVPILTITGGVENAIDDYVNYADMFADAVLSKPLSHDTFLATVRRLLGQEQAQAARS